jgi:DNA end-binding protein Ku
LIKEKQKKKGEKVIQDPDADEPPSRGSNVIDLMAALKKSLGDSGGANDNKGAKKKPAAKKAPARRAAAPAKKTAAGGRKRA